MSVRRSRDSCSFLATCQRNSSTVPFDGSFSSNVEPVVAFISTVISSSILCSSFFSLFLFTQDDLFSLKMGVVCFSRSSKEMWNTNHRGPLGSRVYKVRRESRARDRGALTALTAYFVSLLRKTRPTWFSPSYTPSENTHWDWCQHNSICIFSNRQQGLSLSPPLLLLTPSLGELELERALIIEVVIRIIIFTMLIPSHTHYTL